MLDVSAAYTAAIKDKNRTDRITGTIKLCDGETINITDDIIVNNSVTLKEQLVSGDTFEIGTFYTNQLDITVYDDNFLSRTYANARITPKYEIQLADGTWESVPLGVFTVDNSLTKRKGSIHKLTAFDDSTKFDVDISAYSGGKKTVQQHIKDLAADVGITLATTDFSSYPNYDLAVDSAASTAIQTYRDLVEWCCALMAASARINRYGKLEIVKLREKKKTVDGVIAYDADYTVEGYERTGTEFFDLRALTKYFSTTFDGEQYVYKNRAVITASDTAARNATMFIPENPLLQSVSDRKAAFEACADEINIALRRVEFSFNGNPAIECFDTLCGNGGKIDVNRTIAFFPTSLVWKYRGAHKVSCAFAELTDEATASVSEVATFAAAVANKSPLSTKSKTDKRIDDVSKRANGIGDPIILTENSAKYLDYNYDVVGYYAGDTATYGNSGNDIIVQGYVLSPNGKPIADSAKYSVYTFVNTSTFKTVTIYPVYLYSTSERKDDDGNLYTLYYVSHYGYGEKIDGTPWESKGNTIATRNTNWGGAYQYLGIHAPDDSYPYGSVDISTLSYLTNNDGTYLKLTGPSVGRVPFASIAEYNAAVGLTKSPLQRQLISQTVKKSENYDTSADLPQIGTSDTLYTTLNPPAIFRYDSSTSKYICVGSDFSAVTEIKSDNYATDEYNVLKLPVRQLTKSPSDWVVDNTVYPRGMLLVSQDLTTQTGRYISDIRVANGIDEWKMLKTISPDMSDYLLSTDIADWAKQAEKPVYTADEVGAAAEQHKHSTADITDFPAIPTKVSDLQNDSGYISEETDPTVPAWAKADEKPVYTAEEVGAAAKKHTHTKSEITDFPTLGTAAGKNIDYFAAAGHTHTAAEVGAATAADITAAITDIEIGGRNLLYHSRFDKKYPTGWAYSAVVSYTFDGNVATLTKAETATRQFTTQASVSNGVVAANPNLLPENGCTYTISCEVMKAEGYDVGNGTKITNRYNFTDGTVKDFDVDVSGASETAWTKYSRTYTYASDKTVRYTQFIVALGAQACGIKIRNVKFEKGNKPTDWTPAPEDDERRIASLEARVAALEAMAVSGGEV